MYKPTLEPLGKPKNIGTVSKPARLSSFKMRLCDQHDSLCMRNAAVGPFITVVYAGVWHNMQRVL